jgi:hypothetical protein
VGVCIGIRMKDTTHTLENVANSKFLGMTLKNHSTVTKKLKGIKFGDACFSSSKIVCLSLC